MFPVGVTLSRSVAPARWRLATKRAQPQAQAQSTRFSLSGVATVRCRDGHSSTCHLHTQSRHEIIGATSSRSLSSSESKSTQQKRPRKIVPRKAALALTPKSREIFQKLIAATNSEGILLRYEISSQHSLQMAFKFDLIKDTTKELSDKDEGVSLAVLEDGVTPKPPSESWNDNLPKLYIHHSAFMKVLGGTLDVDFDPDKGDLTPKLFDREGNEMDPNA